MPSMHMSCLQEFSTTYSKAHTESWLL